MKFLASLSLVVLTAVSAHADPSSDFGPWNSRPDQAFRGGDAPIPPVLLPPPGSHITATYNGAYLANTAGGNVIGSPIAAGSYTGSTQINADFGNQKLTGKLGGVLGGALFNAGSTYNSSTGAYTVIMVDWSAATGNQVSLNGSFFGVAGKGKAPLSTAGTLTGRIGSANFTGVFGARR